MLLEFQRDLAAAISAPVEGALRVYRNTVLAGCVDALRNNFPVTARLLGEEMFEAIAADHSVDCPPLRPVLALYGARFPDWLEDQPWIADLPYLPDVARIERLHIEALFAADAAPLSMNTLSGSDDWEGIRLEFHPAARFDWLLSPATSIWLANREAVVPDLDLAWTGEGVLVVRPDLEVHPIRLDRAGHRFLLGLRLGETVAAAAVATAALYPETDIGSLFTSFVNAGAFAGLSRRSLP